MGKIPEYQRRVFAARAVGTPGVDKSGTIIAQAVAQGAGARRQALGVMAGAEAGVLASKRQTIGVEEAGNKAVFKKLFEVGEVLKRVKSIANAAALSKEKQIFAGGMVDRRGEIQKAFMANPEGATKAFTDGNKEALQAHLEQITDPTMRQALETAGNNAIRTKKDQMATWEFGQMVNKAGTDAKAAFVLAEEDAGNIDFTNPQWAMEALDMFGRINDVATDNALGLGVKAETMLMATRHTALMRMISNNIQRNPGVTLDMLNSGMFASEFVKGDKGSELQRDEIQEFIKEAQIVKLAKIEKLERNAAFMLATEQGNIMGQLIDKTMSIADLNLLIDAAEKNERLPKGSDHLEFLKTAKKLALKQFAPEQATQSKAIESITRDFRSLITKKGRLDEKGKAAKKTTLNEGVQLEDLFLFQNRLLGMMDDGLVSSTDAKPLLKILNPYLLDEFDREQGDLVKKGLPFFKTVSFENVFDAGFSKIHHSMNVSGWFDSDDFQDIRAEMYKTFISDFAHMQEQMAIVGKTPTNEDAERIAETAFQMHRRQVNPDLTVYQAGDWYPTKYGPRLIDGFYQDGSPNIRLNDADAERQRGLARQ